MKRTGFKPRITERGRAILAGTGPKIRLDIELEPAPVLAPPVKPRPRPIAPGSGLLAQAMRDNPPAPTERAIKALLKTPDRKDQRIRDSAKDEDCLVRIPGCPSRRDMTIWSHNRHERAGKGGAMKALDLNGAYCCTYCDAVYDGQRKPPPGMTPEAVELAWFMGHAESLVRLRQKGLA